ncbi:MAG: ribonuclease HII [Sphingopyxis sp.]|nr:ribonuclease HII [Sphingopyxis sp.]
MIGVDEAGRGPLAGPVVAAAVLLCDGGISGLDDSKKLSERRRVVVEGAIKARCRWAVGMASVEEIDAINILQATMLAMTRAVDALVAEFSIRHPRECGDPSPDGARSDQQEMGPRLRGGDEVCFDRCGDMLVLVDGNRLPKWRYSARAIVGGDALEPCISAASIIAKQHRDRLMQAADADHPGYGWGSNKGYGSAQHLAALRMLGPTPMHRRSFAPVAQHFLPL